jgi:hypothetical protein
LSSIEGQYYSLLGELYQKANKEKKLYGRARRSTEVEIAKIKYELSELKLG